MIVPKAGPSRDNLSSRNSISIEGTNSKAAESVVGGDEDEMVDFNGIDVKQSVDNLVVIDVNFFPSYKEVPDFPTRLRTFLRCRQAL